MPKRLVSAQLQSDFSKELWINPRSNLKGPDGYRAWDNQGNISPSSGSRFLELADIALGLKKPDTKRKRAAAGVQHTSEKTEPYST
jgi:hypothetical protein